MPSVARNAPHSSGPSTFCLARSNRTSWSRAMATSMGGSATSSSVIVSFTPGAEQASVYVGLGAAATAVTVQPPLTKSKLSTVTRASTPSPGEQRSGPPPDPPAPPTFWVPPAPPEPDVVSTSPSQPEAMQAAASTATEAPRRFRMGRRTYPSTARSGRAS